MKTIEELGVKDTPIIYAYNKGDKLESFNPGKKSDDSFVISARTGDGIADLINAIENLADNQKVKYVLDIPHEALSVVNRLYRDAVVNSVDYTETGATVEAVCDKKTAGALKKYIRGWEEDESEF